MIIEIYADVVFLINIIANGPILYIAGILRRKRLKFWRILLGAASSSLLYTLLIFTPIAPFLNIFTSFIILAPGMLLAFNIANVKDFGLSLVSVYVCAFAMGGVAMASMYVMAPNAQTWSTYGFAMHNFTLQNLVVAIITCFIILKFAQHRIFAKSMARQTFCLCKIYLSDDMVQLNALVDTGNSLIDPISRNPVIIAEFEKIKPLLPKAINELYKSNNQDDLAKLAKGFDDANFATRLRMIPYSAIGKSGVIAGFRPDRLEILQETTQKETTEVIIGICDFSLSNDGEYQALMNPLLI